MIDAPIPAPKSTSVSKVQGGWASCQKKCRRRSGETVAAGGSVCGLTPAARAYMIHPRPAASGGALLLSIEFRCRR